VLGGELGGLLVAGVLPMGCALTTALVMLAKAPAVQEKLAAESSDASLPADPTLLTRAHMEQLPLAHAVVREALRLCPSGVGGGAIAREVPRGARGVVVKGVTHTHTHACAHGPCW
jgi:cytochrome P450